MFKYFLLIDFIYKFIISLNLESKNNLFRLNIFYRQKHSLKTK